MEILKKKVNLFIDEHFDHLWKLASYIHANPEIALKRRKLHMRFLLICRSRDLL